MNFVIPFTKDIIFNNSIAEILSISLEDEFTINENELLGNFIINGEYKTHEVSVNKEKFEEVLPFKVTLLEDVDKESIDLEISDFTYELIDNNTLKVNIEYKVTSNKNEIKEDNELRDLLDKEIEIEDNIVNEEDINDISEEDNNVVMNEGIKAEETFITYKIHIMEENETIDAICTKYNISKDVLEEYNNLNNLIVKDKIIIPEINE